MIARFPQPAAGQRGSLKWIQRAVNRHPEVLNRAILPRLGNARAINWVSPLVSDDFAEYRDDAFLERIGHRDLSEKLAAFWPARGPQWDALALSDGGDVLLVEAKAHIDELFSPATKSSGLSRQKIEAALTVTASAFGAAPRAAWTDLFYQLGNRLAHLHFLRQQGVSAYLVLVNFVGDTEMQGPRSPAEWEAAYRVAFHVLGLSGSSPLMRSAIHAYPAVDVLT